MRHRTTPTHAELSSLIKALTSIYYLFTSKNKEPEERLWLGVLKMAYVDSLSDDDKYNKEAKGFLLGKNVTAKPSRELFHFTDLFPMARKPIVKFVRNCQESIPWRALPDEEDDD